MMIELFWLLTISLSFVALLMGFMYYDEYEFGMEIVLPKTNTFEIGVTNRHYDREDEIHEQELRVAFFFIIVYARFFRNEA